MSLRNLAGLLLVVAISALATSASAHDRKTLRIGSEGAYPPFNFTDSNGELQGFEIDLAKAICAEEKITCEFVAQDWEGLIPALLAGRYDAIFASLSITEERRKVVDFTAKYYSSPSLFVTAKANAALATTPEALAGKTLGAQGGTVSARYLQEVMAPAGAEIKLYVTQDEANLDLASGRLDAVLGDKFVMLNWLEKTADGECCQIVGSDLSDPKFFGDGIGAGVRKGDADVKALIDKGLAAIRANGEYDRINARYFPFSIY
ncbi:lysine/arginine/ornithine ABC transporter substrate-binding protein [Methylopila sp. M107]|uniref:lysine/arginine/ornithine ABC transporter substrate-binding protein n=1 Tax=Methylopila sp. M107 TaxID=1101190 RepID=UPI00037F4158|nr:lysine/arginine/ornithine ABC transporter substrate-binding protein [Methylopila sp. M107]